MTNSYGSLGRKVLPQTLPMGVCKITLHNEKTQDTFHCTGSHVGKTFIKTAAHCLHNSKPTKVECIGDKQNLIIDDVIPYPEFNHREILRDEYNRWQDHALIQTKQEIQSQPFTIVLDEELSNTVREKSSHCLISGFGLQEDASRGTGYLSGSLYPARLVKKQERMLFSHGRYLFELLPGDSGGPLLCHYQNTWYDLGTASAHDWDHNSLYAPNSEVAHWYKKFPLNLKQLNKSPIPKSPPLPLPEVRIGETYYLKTYSRFREKETGDFFFNGDNRYTTIKVFRIKGEQVFGQIVASGASQFYLCEPGYLCFNDQREVTLNLKDISGYEVTPPVSLYNPF